MFHFIKQKYKWKQREMPFLSFKMAMIETFYCLELLPRKILPYQHLYISGISLNWSSLSQKKKKMPPIIFLFDPVNWISHSHILWPNEFNFRKCIRKYRYAQSYVQEWWSQCFPYREKLEDLSFLQQRTLTCGPLIRQILCSPLKQCFKRIF